MMTTDHDRLGGESADPAGGLNTQRLAREARSLLEAFAERALTSVGDKASHKVNEFSRGLLQRVGGEDGGGPGVKAAVSALTALTEGKGPARAVLGAGVAGLKEKVKSMFGGGKGKKPAKVTNIVETLDVGVPLRLAYDQWTQYEDFSSFMKKVENVERPEEEKSNWKAQIFWSHRNWEATTLEQVPDDHIVWRAKGPKGYVDGAVSFSELAPNLTRVCLVMEYHPQGLFEHTGNLWRAQGRRARLELKHFRRHVMAHALLRAEEIEGWRGEIRDGEVVKTHEEAMREEPREEPREEAAEPPPPRHRAEWERPRPRPRSARRRVEEERPRPTARRRPAGEEEEEEGEERPASARRPRRRVSREPEEEPE